MLNETRLASGFTLIELMIAIAILAIVSAIAVPVYQGYIKEARLGVMRTNLDNLRVFLEDYRLENGSYVDAGWTADGTTTTTLNSTYGWRPDGDDGKTTYTVTATNSGASFNVVAESTNDTSKWVRCEDRMTKCCYPGGGGSKTACP